MDSAMNMHLLAANPRRLLLVSRRSVEQRKKACPARIVLLKVYKFKGADQSLLIAF
jgi:hypothetical protein